MKNEDLWHGVVELSPKGSCIISTYKIYNIADMNQFSEIFQTVTAKPKVEPSRRRENTVGHKAARFAGRLPSEARIGYRHSAYQFLVSQIYHENTRVIVVQAIHRVLLH